MVLTIIEAWAWALNLTVVCVVAWVSSRIVLEILAALIDWTLKDRVEDYPGYEETGLTPSQWNAQPIEFKERVWREIKEQEKTI